MKLRLSLTRSSLDVVRSGAQVIHQQVIPLECLTIGESGRIFEVDGAHEEVCRLNEIGFRRGVQVRMVRPGRPCILAIDNHRLSFRGEESTTVLVEVCHNGSSTPKNGTLAG